jgi:hypothetical protein
MTDFIYMTELYRRGKNESRFWFGFRLRIGQRMVVDGSGWQRMAADGSGWQRMAVDGSGRPCCCRAGAATVRAEPWKRLRVARRSNFVHNM